MFERYTEKARRVIFFARYEASTYGSPWIETEHLLLGLIRESKEILRWAPPLNADVVRKRIGDLTPKLPPTSTSVDLPLSNDSQRALKLAADEANRLSHKYIGTEHLFLGLLNVEDCFAAQLLREGGADAAAMRTKLTEHSQPPKPWSFQPASYRDFGFRAISGETVEIHGSRWNVDYVRDVIALCRSYKWHWHKAIWKSRDIVTHRKDGTCSFDLGLAKDSKNFILVKDGWKKDNCFVCRWELFQADDEHGTGYTNGHDWLCMECYERFWQNPKFFSSSQSEMT
jgi:Clp amino terminal domain, pathogenicity island component